MNKKKMKIKQPYTTESRDVKKTNALRWPNILRIFRVAFRGPKNRK